MDVNLALLPRWGSFQVKDTYHVFQPSDQALTRARTIKIQPACERFFLPV